MQFYIDYLERAYAVDSGGSRARNSRKRRTNTAFDMADAEFIKTYRLSKVLVRNLVAELTPHMPRCLRSDGIDTETKILVALAFYAVGSYQTLVGQSWVHSVSQPSVSRAVRQVTEALNKPFILNKYVVFPMTRDHRERIKRDFYNKHHIPGVLGCIDGTHVAIVRPKEHEERYFNRKGYHSLNVLLICDSNLEILCVDSSHPGSAHDSTVWNMQAGEDMFLLGDSGYPLRRIMMTPMLNTLPGSPEALYTDLQVSARSAIERCIGVLKARFRCLLVARKLHYDPTTAAKIVNACCVLHNIARRAAIGLPELTNEERTALEAERRYNANINHSANEQARDRVRGDENLRQGRAYQQTLIQRLNLESRIRRRR